MIVDDERVLNARDAACRRGHCLPPPPRVEVLFASQRSFMKLSDDSDAALDALPELVVYPWDPSGEEAGAEYDRVLGLHRENKATLGHLPYAAFDEAGRRGRLVLGVVDGEVQGYVLYSTPRQQTLKLVHVCVAKQGRGIGLAKAMIAEVITANPDRAMLAAHCRADYRIDSFWRSLDMTPSGQRPGRAAGGSILTIWTRRIGQLDLFESALYASSRALAVLDSNIIIDLYSSEALDRPDRYETLGLTADWVVDLLDLAVSPEVGVDINGLQPADERDRIQHSLNAVVPVRRSEEMRATADALVARMPTALTSKDSSLVNDAKHVADAVLAGADYFVTRDQNLIEATRDWIHAEYEIEVVRPVELLQRFIPPVALTDFRSDQLESVGLSWMQVATLPDDVEESFLYTAGQEKRSSFRKQLQAVLAHPATARLDVLTDERGRRWALLGIEVTGGELRVSTIRVGRGRLGATIAFQLVRHLRALALASDVNSVAITEKAIAPALQAALLGDGFAASPLAVHLASHPQSRDIESITESEAVAAYERKNWPQVILDRDVPVWVIPIQPRFARDLIGYNDTLLHMREKPALGLAREFVYFAAPRVKHWKLPSRVLWYVTKDENARERTAIRGVVAHSRVVDSAVVDVEDAVEQYRSFGVLKEREIRDRAQNGKVLVLRFEDTQELSLPIGRRTFDELLVRHGVTTSLITMRAAKPALFDDVLRLQPGWEER